LRRALEALDTAFIHIDGGAVVDERAALLVTPEQRDHVLRVLKQAGVTASDDLISGQRI
jgi:hypothetical protein